MGQGLSVSAGLPDGWSSSVVNDCTPCTVDEARTLSFSSSCVGCVSSGSAGNELGGVVYSSPVTFGANFDFHGPTFSSTDLSANHLTFTAPFTMTGRLDAYTSPFDVNSPFYSTDLVGSGVATIQFSTLDRFFWAEHVTYDFSSSAPAATPEPASLLLLGTGLAAAWQARRRRRVR